MSLHLFGTSLAPSSPVKRYLPGYVLQAWRPHGDSNPGYRRETIVTSLYYAFGIAVGLDGLLIIGADDRSRHTKGFTTVSSPSKTRRCWKSSELECLAA